MTFLGDWHTHPGGPILPSRRDREAVETLARTEEYGTPCPLMTIVAVPRWPWQNVDRALAFYWRDCAGELRALKPTLTDYLPEEAASVAIWDWPARRRTTRAAAIR